MHNGDSSFSIDGDALNSLPKNLIPSGSTVAYVDETTAPVFVSTDSNTLNISIDANPSLVTSLVSRRAFVAEQKEKPDYNAPDGSVITYLIKGQAGDFGDLCNCKLPTGKTSTALKHQTVQELWNFTAGHGEFWLKDGENETVCEVKKGTSVLIYPDDSFQFRNMSEDTVLESTITTMPPWPGPNEAVKVEGKWSPSVDSQSVQETVKIDSQSIDAGVLTNTITSTVRPVSPSRAKSSMYGSSVSVCTGNAADNTLNVQSSIVGQNKK